MKSTVKILLLLLVLGAALPPSVLAQSPPPVLAFYYAWFDQNTWTSGQSVDLPAVRYNSADPATIERQVTQAAGAGIDVLVQSWYGPQVENNQTETNFRALLATAQAHGLHAAVSFETGGPFFANAEAVTGALTTLLNTHVPQPGYFRYQDKPVIFFWRQQRFSVEQWQAIRAQVDPNHTTLWIAEGTDLSYLAVFDGHHLYSIAWAASPAAELAKWGDRVRAYETKNGVDRLWIATAMPGYDDTKLPRADAFSVPRRNGDYYRAAWQGAVASRPDMIIITSFNEWPEGTQIEPSAGYGNQYLDITRELVTGLKGASPAAAIPAAEAQPAAVSPAAPAPQATPLAGPIIKNTDITNVRSGPTTGSEIMGRLPAGSQAQVTGRTEAGDWWQIAFDTGPGWVAAEVVEFNGDRAAVPVVAAAAVVTPTVTAAPTATATPAAAVRIPAGGTNMRSGPGLNFDLLGRLPENSSHLVTGKDETGEWWQIEDPAGQNGRAWVAAAVVEFNGQAEAVPVERPVAANATPTPTLTPTATPSPTPTVPVIAGSVEALDAINVRSQPSSTGELAGGMYLGETANVLAISPDGKWWQIDLKGTPGWVAAEFVRFTGDKNAAPIFGLGTVTPTASPTSLRPTATPFIFPTEQPTLAPTATSVYQATAAALLANRSTPEATPAKSDAAAPASSFSWSDLPWGLVALVIIAGFVWYQFSARRKQ